MTTIPNLEIMPKFMEQFDEEIYWTCDTFWADDEDFNEEEGCYSLLVFRTEAESVLYALLVEKQQPASTPYTLTFKETKELAIERDCDIVELISYTDGEWKEIKSWDV